MRGECIDELQNNELHEQLRIDEMGKTVKKKDGPCFRWPMQAGRHHVRVLGRDPGPGPYRAPVRRSLQQPCLGKARSV